MDIQRWRAERNRMLETLDVDAAIRQVPSMSRETALLALHKARYDCIDIDPELRHASAAYLRAGGYRDMSGAEILPEGQLP